ncbi:MAG: ornithine cyclodeaminase family protein [Alphaproteobacteria bacterium]|jgi:ornithine cyclodeaminase|nr:ornithine cyclodeaminase family protein [Alphaproteobacteria bacterium]
MRLVGDAEVRAVADLDLAVEAVDGAFRQQAAGRVALQARHRIALDGTKLSTMAAVLPDAGVAGAKVYTTVNGQFRFVVLLFDAASGAPLACLEADAFTEIRTAAVTAVVARALADPAARKLAVFGSGVQARAHVRALAARFPLEEVVLVSRGDAAGVCRALADEVGVPVRPAGSEAADAAVDGAALVVTATRSKTPVFAGDRLAPGAFVAAVGSTLPDGRELDAETIRRADAIVVEWRAQSFAEAGDLVLAEADGALDRDRVVEVAEALAEPARGRRTPGSIVVFESVGIALEDVAVAAAVWRRLTGG